jgi:site-specific DNA-methyltransferase (adenine-specific)
MSEFNAFPLCLNCQHDVKAGEPIEADCIGCRFLRETAIAYARSEVLRVAPDACAGCYATSATCNAELWAKQAADPNRQNPLGCCPDCSHRDLVLTPPANKRVIYKENLSNEWYTPERLRLACWDVFGGYPDLDPATSERNPLRALQIITKGENALASTWPLAATIWCNPPYGRTIKHWIRLLQQAADRDARVLAFVPCRPGAAWYRRATAECQLLCELDGRVTYELPSGEPAPYPARWASALLYWGSDRAAVARKLRSLGAVRMCEKLPATREGKRPELSATAKPIDVRQGRLRLVENR